MQTFKFWINVKFIIIFIEEKAEDTKNQETFLNLLNFF